VPTAGQGLFAQQPAVSTSGTLTYTPAADAHGSTAVDVTLRDNGGTANGGNDTSLTYQFTITIAPPLAFTSQRDGNEEIYVMDYDGANQTRLTNNAARDRQPAWAPSGSTVPNRTGQQVAFTSDRDGDDEIWLMNEDGTNPIQLTANVSISDSEPSWSDMGTQIAFTSNGDGDNDIYIMDADGTNVTPLEVVANTANDHQPAFSPDGTMIAFVSDRDGDDEIYLATWNPNTSAWDITPLTDNTASDTEPAWSPNGDQIAFTSDRSGYRQVYLMNPNGTLQSLLVASNTFDESQPTWSPDTLMQLAFSSNRPGNYEIYSVATNMDQASRLPVRLSNNSAVDSEPDWLK
ncbi:MAG: TolB family protein, partial [Anaerolineae bacterium]